MRPNSVLTTTAVVATVPSPSPLRDTIVNSSPLVIAKIGLVDRGFTRKFPYKEISRSVESA